MHCYYLVKMSCIRCFRLPMTGGAAELICHHAVSSAGMPLHAFRLLCVKSDRPSLSKQCFYLLY